MTLLAFWDFMDSLLPGLPFVGLAIAIWCFYRGVKQWKSGSGGYEGNPPRWVESDEKVNLWTIGAMVHGYMVLAASIVIFFLMRGDK